MLKDAILAEYKTTDNDDKGESKYIGVENLNLFRDPKDILDSPTCMYRFYRYAKNALLAFFCANLCKKLYCNFALYMIE